MTTFVWPTRFRPASMAFGLKKVVPSSRSPYSGAFLGTELAAGRLMVSVTLPPCAPFEAPARFAFFGRLSGGTHRVRIGHFLQRYPAGTMRGTPYLLAPVVRGATELVVQSIPGATLAAGDLIAAGQMFVVAEDCTADGAGVINVPLVNRVRQFIAAGFGVEWDAPTAQFILPADQFSLVYQPGYSEALALDFEEVW